VDDYLDKQARREASLPLTLTIYVVVGCWIGWTLINMMLHT
jgi:hypothetical protein